MYKNIRKSLVAVLVDNMEILWVLHANFMSVAETSQAHTCPWFLPLPLPRLDHCPSEVMGSGFPWPPDTRTKPFSVSLQAESHSALFLLSVLMSLGNTVWIVGLCACPPLWNVRATQAETVSVVFATVSPASSQPGESGNSAWIKQLLQIQLCVPVLTKFKIQCFI